MKEIKNAVIRSTMLGIEDHGCMTALIQLEGSGWSQAFGGFMFGNEERASDCQAQGMALFVRRVLAIAGVDQWEKLPGKHVRIECDNARIFRVGHLLKDEWFDPATEMKGAA